MPFAVAAAATVAAAGIGAYAATQAAGSQADAANNATNLQAAINRNTAANEAPFVLGGQNSLAILLQQLGISQPNTPGAAPVFDPNAPLVKPFDATQFQSSPGYQFQLNQGIDAIQNSASVRGSPISGNTMKDLITFGQGTANQDYWNQYNAYTQRQNQLFGFLQNLAGSGQNAANNLAANQNQGAQTAANAMIGAGNANAAGLVGASNSATGGLNNLAQLAYLYNQGQNANQVASQVNAASASMQ